MSIPVHLITNTFVGAAFYRLGLIHTVRGYLFFIIASVLIDLFDHTLFMVIKHRTVNPGHLIKIAKDYRQKMQANLYILHSPEFNLVLLILALFNHFFLLLFFNNLLHLILDIVEHYNFHHNFKWLRQWSVIYHLSK